MLTNLQDALHAGANGSYVVAASPAMRALERVIADIAPTNIPVLLVGESGTGKEAVALQIHGLSTRSRDPFVKVSCAAVTPEYFGNGHPARITGSNQGQAGTLFLDEISELEIACQPKLLHILLEGDGIHPTAGSPPRVIAATNRNLEEEMHAGRFREELYYRINGVCLRLPPLRHRRQDIPGLVDHFLAKYAALYGRQRTRLGADSWELLANHSWPGNVRELENVVQKIIALGEDAALRDLSVPVPAAALKADEAQASLSLKQASREASQRAERELILKVLNRTRWNRKRAAQELQISYKALLYKLKQIGLEDSAD
jgi:DNA-binding NtrC family response regulator